MRRVRAAIVLATGASALFAMGACAGLVDLPTYTLEPDASASVQADGGPIFSDDGAVTCPTGQKLCQGSCVSTTDPAFGCAAAACDPCTATPGGTPDCRAGVCHTSCGPGFLECDAGGCTAQGPDNCGSCGRKCNANNGGTICNAGTCTTSCGTLTNCNDNCVDPQTDPNNCGKCGSSCARPNANSTCSAGACTSPTCLSGFHNCDGDSNNGCECASPNVCSTKDNTCVGCTAVASACTADVACCNGANCTSVGRLKICCFALGSPCNQAIQCCSGYCYKSRCTSPP